MVGRRIHLVEFRNLMKGLEKGHNVTANIRIQWLAYEDKTHDFFHLIEGAK